MVDAITLYPAIDLKNGNSVRLQQGDMGKATTYFDNPIDAANMFIEQGANWLHIVDLDGAFQGQSCHTEIITNLRKMHPNIAMQLGGGIRNMQQVEHWLKAGISRVIIGTAALYDPAFVKQAAREFTGQIVIGIDTKDGMVATQGWADISTMPALDLVLHFEDAGISTIIHTDIMRDGMLQGVNLAQTAALAKQTSLQFIASGGVASLQDIQAVKDNGALEGVIIGKALYEQKFTLAQALNIVNKAV